MKPAWYEAKPLVGNVLWRLAAAAAAKPFGRLSLANSDGPGADWRDRRQFAASRGPSAGLRAQSRPGRSTGRSAVYRRSLADGGPRCSTNCWGSTSGTAVQAPTSACRRATSC